MNTQSIIYILVGLVALLLVWVIFLQATLAGIRRRQKALFQGKDGKNLENVILAQEKRLRKLEVQSENQQQATTTLDALAKRSIHKTGLVRFNPFQDIGGDQSFSVALLDDFDDGVVISSLYSRDGMRVYAKAINRGKSGKHPLTEEEVQAIKKASLEKNG
ncbi:MAG TPA: DUF4446 family protein [Candidatus Moranbacteria bacterium]|nr:DUF4446 family protein [Candidatus Moranbacteria bacterium]